MAAYGDLNFMKFFKNGTVDIQTIVSGDSGIKRIEESLLLYMGKERDSTDIQMDQISNSEVNMHAYDLMNALAEEAPKAIYDGDLDILAKLMHDNWALKGSLSKKTSAEWIERLYLDALRLVAREGRLCGWR